MYKTECLREALAGGQRELLIARLMDGPGAFTTAMDQLNSWFGGSARDIEHQIRTVLYLPCITSERESEALTEYAIALRSLLANMHTCGKSPGLELSLLVTQKVPRSTLVRYFELYGNGNSNVH